MIHLQPLLDNKVAFSSKKHRGLSCAPNIKVKFNIFVHVLSLSLFFIFLCVTIVYQLLFFDSIKPGEVGNLIAIETSLQFHRSQTNIFYNERTRITLFGQRTTLAKSTFPFQGGWNNGLIFYVSPYGGNSKNSLSHVTGALCCYRDRKFCYGLEISVTGNCIKLQ